MADLCDSSPHLDLKSDLNQYIFHDLNLNAEDSHLDLKLMTVVGLGYFVTLVAVSY